MNVNKPNLFINNNKKNNAFQKYKSSKASFVTTKNISSAKNKYQSDKKIKQNNYPYYAFHKKRASDTISSENQKILLEKRDLEIKDLKMKCQKLEQENYKYQLQNLLLKNSKNNKNNDVLENNTSSNFPIRSEIKKLWENFAKVELLNNFIEFENEPEIIYHIISELILLSDKMIKEHCLLKYQEILKIIGVKNNSVMIKDIETKFKNFMKEHLNEIFNYLKDKSFINDYKNKLKNIVKNSIKSINENNIRVFEEILEQYEFNDMLKNINDIILFTQFNEPTLYFKIEEKYENRKAKYLKINNENKSDYIIINNYGNSKNNFNSIILLEPPCLKSGFYFYKELKPILMTLQQNNEENNINDFNINLDNNNKTLTIFSQDDKNKETLEEKIKFNSINNTSRIKRNLNICSINNNKKQDYNFIYFETKDNNNYINKKHFQNKENRKNKYYDINKILIDKNSFNEENNRIGSIITINTSRPISKKLKKMKKFKKLNISKNLHSDEAGFCSTEDNNFIENKQIKLKQTIVSTHNLNKKFHKIHRIKSANNYFKKNNQKIKKNKIKFLHQNTNIIKKEETNKLYNNYKQYIDNNINGNSQKNFFINCSEDKKTLSIEKNNKQLLTFKNNVHIKNKKLNKKYDSTSNNKDNINTNIRKGNILNAKNNNKTVNNSLTIKNKTIKTNIQTNNELYKNAVLIMKKLQNKEVFSPSKTKYPHNKEYFFKEIELKHNIQKNLNQKNNKKKSDKIKYNNSNNKCNNNLLLNSNINKQLSNLSSNRNKPTIKRIDSFDKKNSVAHSTLEEIKKMIDDGNHIHKPVIMISTNSNINNNTINVNKNLKNKYHYFNKNNKHITKTHNCKTINNSIKQLISLSQPKILDNLNLNYNHICNDNKYNKINTNSLENLHNINNYTNNKGIYCKQFSIDETTFNTSSQFNLTHEYNNNQNKNFYGKKIKENRTIPNDIKIKGKSILNEKINVNKNKCKEIEINIEGLNNDKNNNFNTINAKPNKNRYNNFFHF